MISLIYAAPPKIIQLDDEVGVDPPNPDATKKGVPSADTPMSDACPRQMTRISPAKFTAKTARPCPLAQGSSTSSSAVVPPEVSTQDPPSGTAVIPALRPTPAPPLAPATSFPLYMS